MKNLKKLSRNKLKGINGGLLAPWDDDSGTGACVLADAACPSKFKRYTNAPDNDGFSCCTPPPPKKK
jgi:hypothetical protein